MRKYSKEYIKKIQKAYEDAAERLYQAENVARQLEEPTSENREFVREFLTNIDEIIIKTRDLNEKTRDLKNRIRESIKEKHLNRWIAIIEKAYEGEEQKLNLDMLNHLLATDPINLYVNWSEPFKLLEEICSDDEERIYLAMVQLREHVSTKSLEEIVNMFGFFKTIKEPYNEYVLISITEGVNENKKIKYKKALLALFEPQGIKDQGVPNVSGLNLE